MKRRSKKYKFFEFETLRGEGRIEAPCPMTLRQAKRHFFPNLYIVSGDNG